MRKMFQQIVSIIVQLNPNKHDFQKLPFTNVLQNRSFRKFCKIQMKTLALESLFTKVTGLRPVTLLKKK